MDRYFTFLKNHLKSADVIRLDDDVPNRLTEFGETPSSLLTREEFMTIDLEEEQDPPCFKSARKKKLQQLEDQGKAEEVVEEISHLQIQIEKFLSDRKKKLKLNRSSAKFSQFTPDEDDIADQFVVEETIESINEFVSDGAADIMLPERGPGPTAASLGLKESIEECMRVTENDEPVETGGELDLTGLDDKELESYIMTSEEVKVKTHLWMEVHAEFLEQQKEKQLQKAREEEENAKKIGQPKRKKRQQRKKSSGQAHTAGEAIEKMLLEKKLSCKINYDVLKNLNTPTRCTDHQTAEVEVIREVSSASTGRLTRVASTPKNSGAPPRSISGLMSTILGNHRRKNLEKENEKLNQSHEKVTPVVEEAGSSAKREDQDEAVLQQDTELDQEMEEEVEVEEDDGHLSVAQLLGQHRGEEDMEYYEEEDEQEDYDDYR